MQVRYYQGNFRHRKRHVHYQNYRWWNISSSKGANCISPCFVFSLSFRRQVQRCPVVEQPCCCRWIKVVSTRFDDHHRTCTITGDGSSLITITFGGSFLMTIVDAEPDAGTTTFDESDASDWTTMVSPSAVTSTAGRIRNRKPQSIFNPVLFCVLLSTNVCANDVR